MNSNGKSPYQVARKTGAPATQIQIGVTTGMRLQRLAEHFKISESTLTEVLLYSILSDAGNPEQEESLQDWIKRVFKQRADIQNEIILAIEESRRTLGIARNLIEMVRTYVANIQSQFIEGADGKPKRVIPKHVYEKLVEESEEKTLN